MKFLTKSHRRTSYAQRRTARLLLMQISSRLFPPASDNPRSVKTSDQDMRQSNPIHHIPRQAATALARLAPDASAPTKPAA